MKHKGFAVDSIATRAMNRIYEKSGLDALLTFNAENGSWELTKQSNYINKHGKRERSFGICQMMDIYHAPFIYTEDSYTTIKPGLYSIKENPKFSQQFLDWEKHTDYCLSIWEDANRKNRISTTFYAFNNRSKGLKSFIFLNK